MTSERWQILTGDCLEILPTIPAGSIDAVITDPPYGTTACAWDSVIPLGPMWQELKRVIRPRGAICLFAGQPFTSVLIASNLDQFRYSWIWSKTHAANFLFTKYVPLKKHEDIAIFGGDGMTYNPQIETGPPKINRSGAPESERRKLSAFSGSPPNLSRVRSNTYYPGSILHFGGDAMWQREHPTQKPVDLMRYLIRTYTNAGETVLDFTAGSGSTGVAAILEGRRFIGIELDPAYAEIARRRCRDAAAQPPLFTEAPAPIPPAEQPDLFQL